MIGCIILLYCLLCYFINFLIATLMHAICPEKIHYVNTYPCMKCKKTFSLYHTDDQYLWISMSPVSLPIIIIIFLVHYTSKFVCDIGPSKLGQYIRRTFIKSFIEITEK